MPYTSQMPDYVGGSTFVSPHGPASRAGRQSFWDWLTTGRRVTTPEEDTAANQRRVAASGLPLGGAVGGTLGSVAVPEAPTPMPPPPAMDIPRPSGAVTPATPGNINLLPHLIGAGAGALTDFIRGSSPAPIAAPPSAAPAVPLPVVYNGPVREEPGAAPPTIRDDIVRGLGGRNGQMPSIQQFLASMPQSVSQQFSSGSGQIGNGLGIGGPPTMGYTPASEGPVHAADHTQAAMNAYQHLLGQYTTGPESPSQRDARMAGANAHTLEALARYRPGGLEEQKIGELALQHQREMERDRQRLAAGQLQEGLDRGTVSNDYTFLRGLAGAGRAGGSAGGGSAGGGGAGAVPLPTVTNGPTQYDPAHEELSRLFRESLTGAGIQGTPGPGGRPGQPRFVAPGSNPGNLSPQQSAAMTRFIGGLPDSHLATPEGYDRVLNFLRDPGNAGVTGLNAWSQSAIPREGSGSAEDQARRAAILRLIAANNRFRPNNPIGLNTRMFGLQWPAR